MDVRQFKPDQSGWEAYLAHLRQNDQSNWVLDEQGLPKKPGAIFLGALVGGQVVGSLTLFVQEIIIPETDWSQGKEHLLKESDGLPLKETFVQTFLVEEAYRRRGIGQALQKEAVRVSAALGCYQMRSWSSLDKPANYRLKLKLGFAVHPAIYETANGMKISGAYFVRKLP